MSQASFVLLVCIAAQAVRHVPNYTGFQEGVTSPNQWKVTKAMSTSKFMMYGSLAKTHVHLLHMSCLHNGRLFFFFFFFFMLSAALLADGFGRASMDSLHLLIVLADDAD